MSLGLGRGSLDGVCWCFCDGLGMVLNFFFSYLKTGNETLVQTIETLHQADNLRLRQDDGMNEQL